MAQAGVAASVKIAANVAADLDDWTLNDKGENVDTTAFGSAGSWHTRTPTLKDWDAKIKGRYNPTDTAQVALIGGLNTAFTITLYTDVTHNWTGSGILANIIVQATAKGVVVIEYDFVANGSITWS